METSFTASMNLREKLMKENTFLNTSLPEIKLSGGKTNKDPSS